jgi:hypothetical protein
MPNFESGIQVIELIDLLMSQRATDKRFFSGVTS